MNREIKFRAWHIGEEKMCNVNLLRPDNGAFLEGLIPEPDQHVGDKFIVPALESGRFCDMAEFHLMQFTGTKDKSGKEIYEGDLVRHNAWDYPFEIIFNNEKSQFVCKMKSGLTQCIDSERMLVIGNIYEPLQTQGNG